MPSIAPTREFAEVQRPPQASAPIEVGKLEDFIVKFTAPCDLACDHCYLYTKADQDFTGQPNRMSLETVEAAAWTIGTYAVAHKIRKPRIILHGGEPLLQPPEAFDAAATIFKDDFARAAYVQGIDPAQAPRPLFSVQTNGTRLSKEYLDVFLKHEIGVSISLDGDKIANDRHRLYSNGNSSYERVIAGIQLVSSPKYKRLFNSLLCTIDPRNSPRATYQALRAYSPPAVDIFTPIGNWDNLPAFQDPHSPETPYGDWMIAFFDTWREDYARWHKSDPSTRGNSPPVVRTFQDIMERYRAGPPINERLGSVALLGVNIVINTAGEIELHDAIRTTKKGMRGTGIFVQDQQALSGAFEIGLWRKFTELGLTELPPGCEPCPVKKICGAGFFTDRFNPADSERSFAYPTVYSKDMRKLIEHIIAVTDPGGRYAANLLDDQSLAEKHPEIYTATDGSFVPPSRRS